jgi:hypothetical protein
LYDCTVECSINGEIHPIVIKDKFATYRVAATTEPTSVVFDPNVNTLAEFDIVKGN